MKRNTQQSGEDPSKWPASRLLAFIKERGGEVPQPPIEKAELIRIVKELMDAALLDEASTNRDSSMDDESLIECGSPKLKLDVVEDLSMIPAVELASHISQPQYAPYLRAHPEFLIEVLNHVQRLYPVRSGSFPTVSKWLTDVLNGSDGGASLVAAVQTQSNAVCGKHLTRNDVCFKCLECGADPTCILCAECFKTSPCQNHEYRMVRSGGGMCDCGDPTAWKKESFCTRHRGATETDDPTLAMRAEDRAWIFPCLRASLRLVLLCVRRYTDSRDQNMDEKHAQMIKAISKRTSQLAQQGDCAKRVVAMILCEALTDVSTSIAGTVEAAAGAATTTPPAQLTTTALDELYTLDLLSHAFKGDWWKSVSDIVVNCVSDPYFKVPLCRVMLKYRERSLFTAFANTIGDDDGDGDSSGHGLSQLGVQVLTVPTVVDALLNPKRLMLGGDMTTILDRLVVSILYGFVFLSDRTNEHYPKLVTKRGGGTDKPPSPSTPQLKIAPTTRDKNAFALAHVMIELKYTLKASSAGRAYFANSVILNRAIACMCRMTGDSGWIRRDPDALGSVVAWHIEGRLHPLLGILSTSWRALIRRMLTRTTPPAAGGSKGTSLLNDGDAELSAPLRLMQKLKQVRFEPLSTVEGRGRVLPHVQLLNALLQSECDLSSSLETSGGASFLNGSLLDCSVGCSDQAAHEEGTVHSDSEPFQFLQQLMCIYGRSANDFVRDVMSFTSAQRNVFEPELDPVSFNLPSLRFVASVLRVGLEGGVPELMNAVAIKRLLQSAVAADARSELLHWLEVMTWPGVVILQQSQSLWKRDYMKVSHHSDLYQRLWKGYMREQDVFLPQMLSCVIPPQVFSAAMLRQYSYVPPDGRLEKSQVPLGYGGFLTQLLTYIIDDSKLNPRYLDPHGQKEYIVYVLRHYLARYSNGKQRSSIQDYLHQVLSHDDDEEDEGSEGGGEAARREAIVSAALSEVAVGDQKRDGTWYKIKDVKQFEHINVFSSHVDGERGRHAIMKEFLFAFSRWKAANPSSSSKSNQASAEEDATLLEFAPGVAVPFFAQHQSAQRRLRTLLHSDSAQNIAAFLIVCAALNDTNDIPRVTEDDFAVAVHFLYAVVHDCATVSKEQSGTVQAFSDSIDWDVVENAIANELAINDAEFSVPQVVLPLPQLGSGSLYKKSTITLSSLDLTILKRTNNQIISTPISLVDSLMKLRSALSVQSDTTTGAQDISPAAGTNKMVSSLSRELRVILHHKITVVLRSLKAISTSNVDATASATVETNAEGSAGLKERNEKMERAKRRQKELMEKMKEKQRKSVAALTPGGGGAASATSAAESSSSSSQAQGVTANGSTDESSSQSAAKDREEAILRKSASTSLHTKCLVDALELECCFCQCDGDEEPLCFLSHFTTSSVLQQLGYRTTQIDTAGSTAAPFPWINANIHFCGHVAHPRCVQRHHQHLASMRGVSVRQLLMAQRGYRGMAYLGAAEFACPLCSRTCTTLSFVPQVSKEEDESIAPSTNVSVSSFFSEMCSAAVRHTEYIEEFQQCLTDAAVGFSSNTDEAPLFDIKSEATREMPIRAFADALRVDVLNLRSDIPLTIHRYTSMLSAACTLSSTVKAVSTPPPEGLNEPLTNLVWEALSTKSISTTSIVDFLRKCIRSIVESVAQDDATSGTATTTAMHELLKQSFIEPHGRDVAARCEPHLQPSLTAVLVSMWEALMSATLLHMIVHSAPVPASAQTNNNNAHLVVGVSFENASHVVDASKRLLEMLLPSSEDEEFQLRMWRDVFEPSWTPAISFKLSEPQFFVRSALTPALFRTAVAQRILFLPNKYNEIITSIAARGERCIVCQKKNPEKPIVCLCCGQLMCLQNANKPELFDHARTCHGGAGVFLIVRATSFLIIQGVSGRATQMTSTYVDKYGERDESMMRGVALSQSAMHVAELIALWLSWSWDMDSRLLANSWRHGVAAL